MKKIRLIKGVLVITSCLFIAGCASWHHLNDKLGRHDNNYLAHSEQGRRLSVPEGLTHEQLRNYFIVPHLNQTTHGAPNITPPGSGLAAHLATVDTQLTRRQMRITRDSEGQSTMLIRTPIAKAWEAVDVGLQRAGYKVSVADKKIHSFYILDTAQGKAITRKTAIYKIQLTPHSHGTQVSVFDEKGTLVSPNHATKVLALLRRGISGQRSSKAR